MVKLFKLNEEIDDARKYWLEAMEPHVFVAKDNTKLPYRLYVPNNYTPDKKYPLQMHLHGAGLRGNDNSFQLYHDTKQTQMMFAYQHYEEFIFAIPQCPIEYTWSVMKYDETKREWEMPRLDQTQAHAITCAVHELTLHLAETYSVDRTRMYVSGASMGGAGAYEQLYRYRDSYAGAIVGCTVSDPYAAADLAGVPMYILHGDSDSTISVEHSRKMVQALEKAGGEFVYLEFPGREHDFTAVPTGDAELGDAMRWMFSKKLTRKEYL